MKSLTIKLFVVNRQNYKIATTYMTINNNFYIYESENNIGFSART